MKKAFWFSLYNILIVPLEFTGFYVAALFSGKVRQGIAGRRSSEQANKNFVQSRDPGRPLFIVHCASLGEYEMALPVMQQIHQRNPKAYLVLTFFSPSGYRQVKDTAPADLVTYLPFDSAKKVSQFYQDFHPDKLILTSYEVWPNLIWLSSRYEVEIYLTSARLQGGNGKTLPIIRSFYSTVYGTINHIYPITEQDYTNIKNYYRMPDSTDMEVVGNTRYDRVLERATQNADNDLLPTRYQHAPTFIAGSIWPQDNRVLLPALKEILSDYPELKIVLAPHEPDAQHLRGLEQWCQKNQLSSEYFSQVASENGNGTNRNVLLIDTIGVLAELYHNGDIAYVGGGFSGSVHNVMEPAVAGCATLFGPEHHNSSEAELLAENGGGFSVNQTAQIVQQLRSLLSDKEALEQSQKRAYQLIQQNSGATDRTVSRILEHTGEPT